MAKEAPIFPKVTRHILLFSLVLAAPSLSWANACDPETQNCQCGTDTPQGDFCELEPLECPQNGEDKELAGSNLNDE